MSMFNKEQNVQVSDNGRRTKIFSWVNKILKGIFDAIKFLLSIKLFYGK